MTCELLLRLLGPASVPEPAGFSLPVQPIGGLSTRLAHAVIRPGRTR
jgi:hypothetical protein